MAFVTKVEVPTHPSRSCSAADRQETQIAGYGGPASEPLRVVIGEDDVPLRDRAIGHGG